MSDSLFTKIINGEIPCQKIYEDDDVIAFLDVNPITPGHTLIVPKKQVDHLWDVDDDLYQKVMAVTKLVAARQREVLNPERVGLLLEGFGVPHAHMHVYPLQAGLEETLQPYFERVHNDQQRASDEELNEMAKTLAF